MSNFIIIFFCFILGLLYKRIDRFPRSTSLSLNLFIIYVAMPSLILSKFPALFSTININGHWWIPISMAWITFALSFFFIRYVGKKLNWSKAKMGALTLTAGLGNTSFVGFPLLESLIGKKAIAVGILADQPGSFLIVSSVGIMTATYYSRGETTLKSIIKKVFSFPPFSIMIISILIALFHFSFPLVVQEALEKMAGTLTPLALFAVGFQTDFRWEILKKRKTPLLIGLSFKLCFYPFFFFILFKKIMGIDDLFVNVSILESAMATQITSAVVASEFHLDSELANLMVSLSIPISLLTVTVVHYLI